MKMPGTSPRKDRKGVAVAALGGSAQRLPNGGS
jgi:hypothetical protein